MIVAPEALLTSFGPFGRSKLIKKERSGEIIISRDGQQILQYCSPAPLSTSASTSSPSHPSAFLLVIRRACIDFGKLHGDGSSSCIFLLEYLLTHIISSHPDLMPAMPSPSHEPTRGNSIDYYGKGYQKRISLIQSFNHVTKVLQLSTSHIKSHFINQNILKKVEDYKQLAIGIWTNLLVPATNPTIATNLILLMLQWFDEKSGSTTAVAAAINSIHHFQQICKFLLEHIDTYVINTKIGSFYDSHILGECEYMLEGRLHEHSSLLLSASKSKRPHLEYSDKFRFVCIKNISAEQNVATIVKVKNESDAKDIFRMGKIHLSEAFNNLSKVDVKVVFTCDNVGGDLLFMLKTFGLFVVDCVPLNYLIGLATFAHIQIIDDCDTLAGIGDDALALFFTKSMTSFKTAERIVYSPQQSFVYIHGVNRKNSSLLGGIASSSDVYVSQMLLHGGGSESIANMYTRLIMRCLKLVVATKVFRQEADACDGNDSVLVAEGMGTIEVTWCKLLRNVNLALTSTPSEVGINQAEAMHVERMIAHQLKQCCSCTDQDFLWQIKSISFVLEAIASAHERMLRLLLNNAFGCKNSHKSREKIDNLLGNLMEPQLKEKNDDNECQRMELQNIFKRIDLFESSSLKAPTLPARVSTHACYMLETLAASRLNMVLELVQLFLKVDHHHTIYYTSTSR